MLLFRSLVRVFLFATVALAFTVQKPKVDRGSINLSIGDITIQSGSFWSIFDNTVSIFKGDLWVQKNAGFFITSTNKLIGLKVELASGFGSIRNDGLIVFNSLVSITPSFYKLIGKSFLNSGEIFLVSSGYGVPTAALLAPIWKNTGSLTFFQNKRNNGVVSLGAPGLKIENWGQICLFNELYKQTTHIFGDGCITADQDSSIFFSNCLLDIDSRQTVYLADSRSSVRAVALAKPKTFKVAGFGNGNKIGLDLPLISPFSKSVIYNAKTGILSLRVKGFWGQDFNIGLGYNSNKFKITTDNSLGLLSVPWGAVYYDGPVPNKQIPSNCQPCKPYPSPPTTTTTKTNAQTTKTSTWTGTFTTTVTETDTPGGTDTVIVEVPSTPNSQTTLTSTWTGTFTTTVTETDTPGGT
ncbi:hyphally regulated cell wall protein, partial [Scheffersomyces stipitis CBS 6054]